MVIQIPYRFIVSVLIVAVAPVVYGCEAGPDSTQNHPRTNPASTATPVDSAHPVTTLVDARPAALINGQPLTWGEMRAILNELGGAEALQEVILDRTIANAASAAGIVITDDDVVAERKLLIESLDRESNRAIMLLDELRERQNLGKHRFDALLRRNATLRALVRSHVTINEEAIMNMHEFVHGPKRQGRLMVLDTLESAQAAINLVNSGVSFADVAVEMSVDSSAPRGGLLEPISRVDPAYPDSLRQALWSLNPGEMSGPILIENRYAVAMLVKRIGGESINMNDVRPALERLVRLQQERMLMDQLARRMLAETQVTVFDDALHESWMKRRQ